MTGGLSALFIKRPVAATLVAFALLFAGAVAYPFLPVASLPSVEIPTIVVAASRPGADPQTIAASVAAPLERTLGSIPGVTEMTSSSSSGSTRIVLQFDLKRKIESAAQDVQAALNAAVPDLPGDLPSFPVIRKVNPNARPVLILAVTSDTLAPPALFDMADSLIAQRLAQVRGVGEVTVNGSEQPAIRVRVDPARLAAMGLGIDQVRAAIAAASAVSPLGAFDGERSETLDMDARLDSAAEFGAAIVRTTNGASVRLRDVAEVTQGVRNTRTAGWFNGKPAIIVNVTQEPGANVIETIDGVKAILPDIARFMPAGVNVAVMSDRSTTIRASILDLQKTLGVTVMLVTLVVFLFLRRLASTAAAAVAVPLSLAGTFALMWACGFSLDNLSLMAITIAVGFVVDDAIVMIETIHRNMEGGEGKSMGRLEAALAGSRQIGFTVVSMSLSLIAAFIPLMFMGGVVGRVFREFALTLSFAIVISMLVSLTITPMICGQFMPTLHGARGRFDTLVERALEALERFYARTLDPALRHPVLMVVLLVVVSALTVQLYRTTPKGWFPQDDSGLLGGWSESPPDTSFEAMMALQQRAAAIIMADPAVESTASFVGGSSVNTGRLTVALKPEATRGASSSQVMARLRPQLARVIGIQVYLWPTQDIQAGGREGRSRYQFTLWSSDYALLLAQSDRVLARLKLAPQLVDVASDASRGGLQANIVIDRPAAARLGVSVQDISTALADAFTQRQISTIYTSRNQYRVVLEISPDRQRDPDDLMSLHVTGAGGKQIPLASLAHVERAVGTLTVNHQGHLPSVTFTYDTAPGATLDAANAALREAVGELRLPDAISADFAGDAKAFRDNAQGQLWLILAALVTIYIILGVLYESLIHPLTILSTLPPAGLGALLALNGLGTELTLVAFIGIVLLIGIVKKNGIIMVDFAIVAERSGMSARDAARTACLHRFRPILMTTLAALLGALPLALGEGPGAELRRPLGITVAGGLIASQILTLYTTPAIYMLMSRLRRRRASGSKTPKDGAAAAIVS